MLNRLTCRILQKRIPQISKLSTAAEPLQEKENDIFRTQENNPINHSKEHLSKFYKISNEDKKKLFLHGGFPKSFEIHVKTFNENCLMVREPALDIINCLKNIDYTKSIMKFVLYGKQGAGKTLTLAHIIHFGQKSGYLIVHVPWVGNWMRRCKESCNSTSKEGNIDLPLDSASWLIHFKNQNQHLLSNPELVISKDYHWSKRESTPKGSTLLELIDHGINRAKYASDCIVNLAEEIKILSTQGKCKTLVAIDGFNAFFYPNIRIWTEKKEPVHPSKVTITEAFLNLTKWNWTNGVAVLTVDELAIAEEDQTSHLPMYLLGQSGFEHLDPFIPVEVPEYSEKELISCLEYFRERRWIQTTPEHDKELGTITAYNPYRLMQICVSL